jgi:hypothetical protein
MNLSPENAQQLTNLQERMLANIAAGKASFDGLTEDQIREGLSFLRQNRAASASLGGKTKAKNASGKAKKPKVQVQIDTKAFTDLDLD